MEGVSDEPNLRRRGSLVLYITFNILCRKETGNVLRSYDLNEVAHLKRREHPNALCAMHRGGRFRRTKAS